LKPPAPEPQAVAAGPAPAPAAPPPAPIPADRIDTLTGLANENGLMAWFREKGARLAADNMGIIVLVAKLDGFAQIVARYGAAKGDLVVKEIAARVAVVAKTEGDGIAARTGGEEFGAVVAVVPNKSDAVAAERAGHLLELIGRPIEHADGAIWVGGCVGAAAGSPLAGPATLERARVALAKAARMGRGQCAIAPSE
jgi:diguanylate cyclase (GGDEF)-like protein